MLCFSASKENVWVPGCVCADWLQDCTSPGKTLFTKGPWIIALLKGWFYVRIQPLAFPLLKGGFLQVVALQKHKAGVRCWCKALTHKHLCDSEFAQMCQWWYCPAWQNCPKELFHLLVFTWWNTRQGCALLTGERRGRAEGAALAAGRDPVVCPKLCCHPCGWHEFLWPCWALLIPLSHNVCKLHNCWSLFMQFSINASIPPSTFFASCWKSFELIQQPPLQTGKDFSEAKCAFCFS